MSKFQSKIKTFVQVLLKLRSPRLKAENTCGRRGHDIENASTFPIFIILECVQFWPVFMLYSSKKGFISGSGSWASIWLFKLRSLPDSHTESLLRNYASSRLLTVGDLFIL